MLWASLAHFGGVLWFAPSLVIYLRQKDVRLKSSRTEDHADWARRESKEALNWQISFTLGYLALLVLSAILGGILLLTPIRNVSGFVWLIPLALYAVNVALSITAGLRVSVGGAYRYPVAIRLLK